MAGTWDSPPTETEKVDPWSAPPTEAERAPGVQEPERLKTGVPGHLSASDTGLLHLERHGAYGLGDKLIAGIQAVGDKLHDKTGKVTLGDAYSRDLAYNDKALEQADEEHPGARWAGNVAGTALSVLAPAGALRLLRRAAPAAAAAPTLLKMAGQGAKTGAALGAVGGFGGSRADTLGKTAVDTAAGAGAGAALGAAAPVVARGAGTLLRYAGDKAKDAGGWLKVNSIHPTPALGKAMEDIPGGRVGVGRELLDRGLGGFTKHGTAEQIAQAAEGAGGDISRIAKAYDAAGRPALDLTGPLDQSMVQAADLASDPLTRDAGNRLGAVAGEYRQVYDSPTSAVEALALKRKLADAAYKHTAAARAGDTVAGDFGAGLGKLERGVDAGLDSAIGPEFEAANVSARRLYKAKEAAENLASRGHGNHILGGLMTTMAGGAGLAHGGPHEAIPLALGSLLFNKYGSQVGARALYGAGSLAETLGGARLAGAVAPAAAAAESLDPYTEALMRALRGPPPQSRPTLAMKDETP